MRVEAGKYYRTSDGQIVGPMELSQPGGHYYVQLEIGRWRLDGTAMKTSLWDNPQDIVCEWGVSPTRTVTTTRAEIVPGVYKGVDVGPVQRTPDAYYPVVFAFVRVPLRMKGDFTAPELTDAIATLTAIRDALVEVA